MVNFVDSDGYCVKLDYKRDRVVDDLKASMRDDPAFRDAKDFGEIEEALEDKLNCIVLEHFTSLGIECLVAGKYETDLIYDTVYAYVSGLINMRDIFGEYLESRDK